MFIATTREPVAASRRGIVYTASAMSNYMYRSSNLIITIIRVNHRKKTLIVFTWQGDTKSGKIVYYLLYRPVSS